MSANIRWPTVLAHVARSWALIAATTALVAAATAAYVLTRPREYDASMTVVTIGSSRQGSLPGGLASTLLGTQQTGVQATPAFVAKLVRLRSVTAEVADALVPAAAGYAAATAAERILEAPAASVARERQLAKVNDAIGTAVDRESGLITVQVVHEDTALARVMVSTAVDAVQRKFIAAAREQAAQTRRAQDARVDSAYRQVRASDLALSQFLSANRVVAPFSVAAVEQRRLETASQLAQQVYAQTMTERQAAIARELESLPAVMVLDPVPRRLLPVSRRLALKLSLAVVASLVVTVVLVVLRAASVNAYRAAGADGMALVAALSRVPAGGRLVRWWCDVPAGPPAGRPTAGRVDGSRVASA